MPTASASIRGDSLGHLRAGFLTSAAKRGASIFKMGASIFKMMYVTRRSPDDRDRPGIDRRPAAAAG
jgi:hypothetical protein